MGRKAKLKKQRHQNKLANSSSETQPQNFIKRIEKEGYRLDRIERSPEIPRDDVEPQV